MRRVCGWLLILCVYGRTTETHYGSAPFFPRIQPDGSSRCAHAAASTAKAAASTAGAVAVAMGGRQPRTSLPSHLLVHPVAHKSSICEQIGNRKEKSRKVALEERRVRRLVRPIIGKSDALSWALSCDGHSTRAACRPRRQRRMQRRSACHLSTCTATGARSRLPATRQAWPP